jgi:hypothetical protein
MAPSSDGVARQVINPAYGAWIQQDQDILSAIQSSLTESVAGMILFSATSQEGCPWRLVLCLSPLRVPW